MSGLSSMEILRQLRRYGHDPDVHITKNEVVGISFSCRLCKQSFRKPFFRNSDGSMPEFPFKPCPRNMPNWVKARDASKKGALI